MTRTEINRRAAAALAHALDAIEVGDADSADEAVEIGIDAYTADVDDADFTAIMRATNDLARAAGLIA